MQRFFRCRNDQVVTFLHLATMFSLRDEILLEHSRTQSQKIADWVGCDKKRFEQLLELFLHDEYRVVQRTAWIVSIIAERYPILIEPHLYVVIGRMSDKGIPVAVKRNVVRILQHVAIPEALHGEVMNTCFGFFEDINETIAVRCFSMTVLANLAQYYPEIKQEIKLVIEDTLENGASAGFRSRAKRTLSDLGIK